MAEKMPVERAEEVLDQFANAPIGLCYFDKDLRFRYINQWLADLHGPSPELHLGKSIHEIIDEVAVRVVPKLRQVLKTGEPILDGEVKASTPATNGELRLFRYSFHPALNSDGQIAGVSTVVQDITELRHAESTLYEGLEKVRSLLSGPPAGF